MTVVRWRKRYNIIPWVGRMVEGFWVDFLYNYSQTMANSLLFLTFLNKQEVFSDYPCSTLVLPYYPNWQWTVNVLLWLSQSAVKFTLNISWSVGIELKFLEWDIGVLPLSPLWVLSVMQTLIYILLYEVKIPGCMVAKTHQ